MEARSRLAGWLEGLVRGAGALTRPARVDAAWLQGWRLKPSVKAAAGAASATGTWATTRPPRGCTAAAVAARVRRTPPSPVWRLEGEAVKSGGAGPRVRAVRAVLADYSCTTTLHGVGFAGDDKAGLAERCMWAVAVLASAALLGLLCSSLVRDQTLSPTVMKIEQNDLPTFSFPFPAVTLCPTVRFKLPVLSAILVEYADKWFDGEGPGRVPGGRQSEAAASFREMLSSNGTHWHPYLLGIGHALFHYQYPKYRLMQMGLSLVGGRLPFFDGLPISQIMRQARPKCSEVLARCYWRGAAFSCCDQFQLQRTEMGYCMSFNSRTSTGPKILCSEKNCHHLWSTGPGTGLLLVLRTDIVMQTQRASVKLSNPILSLLSRDARRADRADSKPGNDPFSVWDSEHLFLTVNSWTEVDHVLVMVHDRWTFPMVTRAFSFSTSHKGDYSLAVSYMGTKASPGLEMHSVEARRCVLPGERWLQTTRRYTQRECLAQCRSLHIARECGCRPYYIEPYAPWPRPGPSLAGQDLGLGDVPECRFSQLPCLSGLNLVAINCSHCVPLCAFNDFIVRTLPSVSVNTRDAYLGTTLDISYDMFRTAVLYRKQPAVTGFNMLVTIGGLASLCLGCSILSSLDILQVLRRVVQASLGYDLKLIYSRSHNP